MAYHGLKWLSLRLPLLMGICCADAALWAAPPLDDAASRISNSFRCPEELRSQEAKEASLHEFMEAYRRDFPDKTVGDLMRFRYRLLVSHACTQTLAFMLEDVDPLSEMLRVANRDFGPRTEEFDPKTKVWTVRFNKDGLPPSQSEESLLFNFYGWNPPVSPEAIANAFISPREDLHILGKFGAPDEITKARAYFIVSETLYPGEKYGYLNISKITSVGKSAYTVTFTRVIMGESTKEIAEKGKAWYLSEEGKAISDTVNRTGVDASWEEHFAENK
jgi:hypothetical protein